MTNGNTDTNTPAAATKPEDMDATNDGAPALEVAASQTRLQLQPFWPQKSNTWFQLAEIQFGLQGIKSDRQKYMYTLSALSPDTCDTISDFLQNPPTEDRYQTLKATLLDRLAPSNESQLEALLTGQQLGDRRPSDALRHIRTLAGNNFSETLIKSFWIRKMPQIIKIALVAQPESIAIETLARTADKMYEVINTGQQHPNINPINAPKHFRPELRSDTNRGRGRGSPVPSTTLEDRMARLESRLEGMFRSRSRSRGRRSNSNRRSHSPSNNNNQQGKCWYHARFGSAAHKCIPPCTFKQSQQSTSGASGSHMEIDNSKNI